MVRLISWIVSLSRTIQGKRCAKPILAVLFEGPFRSVTIGRAKTKRSAVLRQPSC